MSATDKFQVPEGAIQIGPNDWYQKVVNSDEEWVGLHAIHHNPQDRVCFGYVAFDIPYNARTSLEHKWQVENWEPEHLTLSPSLLCSCGHHGWIRDGKWVSA